MWGGIPPLAVLPLCIMGFYWSLSPAGAAVRATAEDLEEGETGA